MSNIEFQEAIEHLITFEICNQHFLLDLALKTVSNLMYSSCLCTHELHHLLRSFVGLVQFMYLKGSWCLFMFLPIILKRTTSQGLGDDVFVCILLLVVISMGNVLSPLCTNAQTFDSNLWMSWIKHVTHHAIFKLCGTRFTFLTCVKISFIALHAIL